MAEDLSHNVARTDGRGETDMARLLYFASVREAVGRAQEDVVLPEHVRTTGALLAFLRGRGEPYASALAGEHLKVAVDQAYARPDDPVDDGREIAIFPPVTGG